MHRDWVPAFTLGLGGESHGRPKATRDYNSNTSAWRVAAAGLAGAALPRYHPTIRLASSSRPNAKKLVDNYESHNGTNAVHLYVVLPHAKRAADPRGELMIR